MTTWIDISGAVNAVAIYTGDDDAPLTAPLSHVDRLKFHSSLPYPYVVDTRTGTLSLPTVAANTTERTVAHTLFAHGRGSTPYTYGKITSGLSTTVPLQGGVVVQVGSGLGAVFPRVLHLGADATNVYINEYASTHSSVGLPALTLGWTVYVMETGAVTSDVVDITPDYFLAGNFDSRRRYMRADATGADMPIPHNQTFHMVRNAAGQDTAWRYLLSTYDVSFGTVSATSTTTLVKI